MKMTEEKDVWVFEEGATRYEICYTPSSIRHPAKGHIPMYREIIKRYTKPNELILDVMAGIGTTLVEGMLLGRNVIGIEYEQKFVDMAQANIELTKKKMSFMKSVGNAKIIKGDSRELSKILNERAENNIFSPPFSNVTMEKKPEVPKNEVDTLYKQLCTCPKCGFQFQKGEE